NSHSFAAEALRRGGFFGPGTAFPEMPLDDRLLAIDPASGQTRPLRVPAFSARLKNPINIFEHRFTRWPQMPIRRIQINLQRSRAKAWVAPVQPSQSDI